jgi:hypothetical protein
LSESQTSKLEKRVKALEDKYVELLVLAHRLQAALESLMQTKHRVLTRAHEKK